MMSHFDIKMEKVNVFIFLGKTFNITLWSLVLEM